MAIYFIRHGKEEEGFKGGVVLEDKSENRARDIQNSIPSMKYFTI